MNHVFEESPIFLAHQMLPEHMNAAFARPKNNLYLQMYNLDWINNSNFSWGQNTNEQRRPNFFNDFQLSHYQQNFAKQVPPPSFQNSQMETIFLNLERRIDTFIKNQETLT